MKTILLLLLVICISTNKAQSTTTGKEPIKIVVMPYNRFERFPYNFDQIREALQMGLLEKGFSIVNDDETWEIILGKDYSLYDLSKSQADTLINSINADLILYGFADLYEKNRQIGMYSERKISRPILVKVFDKKKNDIILHERVDFVQHWGLNVKLLNLRDFGVQIAYKLKQLGY